MRVSKIYVDLSGLSYEYEPNTHCFCMGRIARERLKARGLHAIDLLEKYSDADDGLSKKKVEKFLYGVYTENSDPLSLISFQRVWFAYARFYRFRKVFECLFSEFTDSEFVLSSGDDADIKDAFVTTAMLGKNKFCIDKKSGFLSSSILSSLATYDLPSNVNFLRKIFVIFSALVYRAIGAKLAVQGHSLRYARSFRIVRFSLGRVFGPSFLALMLGKGDKRHEYQYGGTSVIEKIKFDELSVDDFDQFYLNHEYRNFCTYAKKSDIFTALKYLNVFFKISGVKKIISNADNTPLSIILSEFCTDIDSYLYLPHGIIIEDKSFPFWNELLEKKKLLAWNFSQERALENSYHIHSVIGMPGVDTVLQSLEVTHDVNGDLNIPHIEKAKVLVLTSEWCSFSEKSRPDCFENDLLDVSEALSALGIKSADVKIHDGGQRFLQAKYETLKAIRPFCKVEYNILAPGASIKDQFEQYDLVIVGPTTAIIELCNKEVQFVCFRALKEIQGVLSSFSLSEANSVQELISEIVNYNPVVQKSERTRLLLSLKEQKVNI